MGKNKGEKGSKIRNKEAGLVGKGGTGYLVVGRVKLRSAGTGWYRVQIKTPFGSFYY
jgi:hypothetical protein